MQNDQSSIWVVDDDADVRSYLCELLKSRGHAVVCIESGELFLDHLRTHTMPSLVLLDIRLPDVSGLALLDELHRIGRHIPSIVLSGVDDIPTVVQAMRSGASDYLVKPIEEKDLEAAMAQVLVSIEDEEEPGWSPVETAFQSSNWRMRKIRTICDKVADTDVPVLIQGESGVGKEVVARYIHEKSGRREPFLKVNCAALPNDLLESELFGHERGAFTGAQREKPGKFELAGRGTIMLDEVAEMNPMLQAKLLHVLQDGEYCRLGGVQTLVSEARLITATNKRLDALVASGEFREDLYFRLNVITMEIPPLRDRREDIIPLCNRFVERYRGKYGSPVKQLPPELLKAFKSYQWPGNVRQLENSVKRFLILLDVEQAIAELEDKTTTPTPRFQPLADSPANVSLKERAAQAAERAEKELVFQTLKEVNWNRKKAARQLKICYKSLLSKLHRWQRDCEGQPVLPPEPRSPVRAAQAEP